MRIDPDTCRDPDLLAAEVRRLRAALEELRSAADQADAEYRAEIATLKRLTALQRLAELDEETERTIPTDDSPKPALSDRESLSDAGKSVETDIPPAWLQKPYWVDPPSGWAYGFPRLYDPATDGDMTDWMIANGYPERLARQGLPCTFTAQE